MLVTAEQYQSCAAMSVRAMIVRPCNVFARHFQMENCEKNFVLIAARRSSWFGLKVRYIKVRLATYNIRPGEGCLARQSGMYLYMHSASQRLHSSLALVRSDRVVFRSG